jgi:hypothetical protein
MADPGPGLLMAQSASAGWPLRWQDMIARGLFMGPATKRRARSKLTMNNPDDVTRRDFLKLGVAAGATAALGSLAVGQQKSADQVRCGFIGVGGRGTALLDQTLGFDDVV